MVSNLSSNIGGRHARRFSDLAIRCPTSLQSIELSAICQGDLALAWSATIGPGAQVAKSLGNGLVNDERIRARGRITSRYPLPNTLPRAPDHLAQLIEREAGSMRKRKVAIQSGMPALAHNR